MIAYVTSIGEATTGICVWQLKRFGFEVILLGGKEDWFDKYCRFIDEAEKRNENCFRVDADIIVNKKIESIEFYDYDFYMAQFTVWDFYKNDISQSCPILYGIDSFKIIKNNLNKIDKQRPECSASRLEKIHPRFVKNSTIVGMHGFFQDLDDQKRAYESRKRKNQLDEFDFDLVNKIREL